VASDLVVVGLSYKTAPLDVREKLAFPDGELEPALKELNALPSVGEAIVLSTCNRVEIYAATRAALSATALPAAAGEMRRFLATSRGVDSEKLAGHLYERTGPEAVQHIFRVASSLDSLVVGESQILGQLKSAYGAASKIGCVGPLLARCLERAFGVAKRVRSETAIARGAANVSSVAVELARKIFGDLGGKIVLVIGAGKMSDLAARHLRADGAADILVTNRSPEKAEELADKVDGEARPWADLDKLLATADIVVSSTGSRDPIITVPMMKGVVKARRHRPLFLIDIAVPRDVEAKVGKLDGVYLFDIDDLERVVADNLKERRAEAAGAQKIVDAEAAQFQGWLRSQGVVPTIKDLRERFAQIARAEAEKTLGVIGAQMGEKEQKAIRQMAEAIVAKLLHTPLMALKSGDGEEVEQLVATTRRLFNLAAPTAEGEAQTPEAAPPAVVEKK
jgi:glutamyl-tRNA reductase